MQRVKRGHAVKGIRVHMRSSLEWRRWRTGGWFFFFRNLDGSSALSKLASTGMGSPAIRLATISAARAAQVMPRDPMAKHANSPRSPVGSCNAPNTGNRS